MEGMEAREQGSKIDTYSKVKRHFGILLLDPCEEAGFLAWRELVGQGGGGGEGEEGEDGEKEGREGKERMHAGKGWSSLAIEYWSFRSALGLGCGKLFFLESRMFSTCGTSKVRLILSDSFSRLH